jgi:hypothetical protein
MAERIKSHSERAERFRMLRDQLARDLGYDPSNAEAMGIIMSEFPESEYPPPRE